MLQYYQPCFTQAVLVLNGCHVAYLGQSAPPYLTPVLGTKRQPDARQLKNCRDADKNRIMTVASYALEEATKRQLTLSIALQNPGQPTS